MDCCEAIPVLLIAFTCILNPEFVDNAGLLWIDGLETSSGEDLANPPSAEALQSPVPSLVHLEQVLRLSDWFYDCTPTSQSIASQHQLVELLC